MHGHISEEQFLESISGFLGSYYLALALINGIAALYAWRRLGRTGLALAWLLVSVFFVCISPLAFSGNPDMMSWVSMPDGFKQFVDTRMANAVTYSVGTISILVVLFLFRKLFVHPIIAWIGLNLSLVLMGFSMTDSDFSAIVTKPDNVPIVGMVYLLAFFTWLATTRAVQNDERIAQGLEPLEKLDNEKVLVWPDLVYIEMICMVALTAVLILWAIGLDAPLEEPASIVKTPASSKAPWYFLGLQEMLVYFDPWMAGVVLPGLVVFGLMAIPFLDFNKKGSGYYTINDRRFAYVTFQIGFLGLWVTLIVLGTFLRGPNWNFFGPYELWDPHKIEALNNVQLSQLFWIRGLGMALPAAPEGSGFVVRLGYILWRELPGIVLVFAYLLLIPPVLAITVFRDFYTKMGLIRFMVMSNLLLMMALLPIKMALRWSFNLKYIISIPEYFLNF